MDKQIIFGAPGCGKTTKLMEILEKELKTVAPNRIAFVSFTRKGTYEGRDRAMELFKYEEGELPYFRTLHSIAFREGGFNKYDMINNRFYKEFSDLMGMNFIGYYTNDYRHTDDLYLHMNFLERNNVKMAYDFMTNINQTIYKSVQTNYAQFKKKRGLVDFTDIISAYIKNNTALPVDVVIIDEAQDLTTLQWNMCAVAFRDCKRAYIAGDDDQAIFEWSGSDVPRFLKQKGERLILDKSYRLRINILELAKRVSSEINDRVEKDFEPVDKGGHVLFYNHIDELSIHDDETYYFLSRTNWFLSKHREFLMKKSKVFMDKTKVSVEKAHIEAIHMFEHIRKRNGKDVTDQEQIKLQLYCRDGFTFDTPWFDNFKFDIDRMNYYRDVIKNKTPIDPSNIMVNTIHGVKGGEADNVVLLLDFTKSINEGFLKHPDAEWRCLYVALTRAKKNLHIIHSNSKNGYEKYIDMRGVK